MIGGGRQPPESSVTTRKDTIMPSKRTSKSEGLGLPGSDGVSVAEANVAPAVPATGPAAIRGGGRAMPSES
jgi:hypothetical protein